MNLKVKVDRDDSTLNVFTPGMQVVRHSLILKDNICMISEVSLGQTDLT